MKALPLRCFITLFFVLSSNGSSDIDLNSIIGGSINGTITARNIVVTVPQIVITTNNIVLNDITVDVREVEVAPEKVASSVGILDHADLASSMNNMINPCDDFYEYVCYNWPRHHPVKEYELRSNQMSVNVESVNNQLLDIFKEKAEYGKNRVYTMLYDAFDQCNNSKQRNELRSQPLFDVLNDVRSSNLLYITDWLIKVQPISLFYKLDIGPNFKNTSRNTIFLNLAGTFFTHYFYLEPQYSRQLMSIRSYLSKILNLMKTDDTQQKMFPFTEAELARRVNSFVEIETAVGEIFNSSQRDDGRSNADRSNLQTVSKLQEIAPSVNWKRYLNSLIPSEVLRNVTYESLTIEFEDLETVKQLEILIRDIPNNTLADYLEWKVILNYVGYLDDRYQMLKLDLNRVLYGVEAQQPKEQSCISDVSNFFTDVISVLYVRKHFSNESREMVRTMVDNIEEAYIDRLKHSRWMDDETKREGIEKVRNMIEFIGYSDHIFDVNKTRSKYEKLSFDSSMRYIDIVEKLGKWSLHTSFYQLTEHNERDKFEFMATDVNAFYDPSLNQIALLAGILQGAYFNESLPPPMNYGGIGVVIGHEMMHGFDDAGNEFDKDGNRRPWFDKFQEMRKCFIEQYSNIQVLPTDTVMVNGEQTVRENIADNGGIRSTYTAMMNHLAKQNIDPHKRLMLRNVGILTMEQLFFISHAYTWCGSVRPEALVDQVLNDSHTPDKYRVNVVMTNFPEFFSAFQCSSTSTMSMNVTCKIW